jgi:hypothetical protein
MKTSAAAPSLSLLVSLGLFWPLFVSLSFLSLSSRAAALRF